MTDQGLCAYANARTCTAADCIRPPSCGPEGGVMLSVDLESPDGTDRWSQAASRHRLPAIMTARAHRCQRTREQRQRYPRMHRRFRLTQTGITRSDHIVRWQPEYYDGKAADAILGSVELARD